MTDEETEHREWLEKHAVPPAPDDDALARKLARLKEDAEKQSKRRKQSDV